jgi:hypothetical protein
LASAPWHADRPKVLGRRSRTSSKRVLGGEDEVEVVGILVDRDWTRRIEIVVEMAEDAARGFGSREPNLS